VSWKMLTDPAAGWLASGGEETPLRHAADPNSRASEDSRFLRGLVPSSATGVVVAV